MTDQENAEKEPEGPALWLIMGGFLALAGAVVLPMTTSTVGNAVGLSMLALGGIAATVGAVGVGVLSALRLHDHEVSKRAGTGPGA
jgi:hypothetical protein